MDKGLILLSILVFGTLVFMQVTSATVTTTLNSPVNGYNGLNTISFNCSSSTGNPYFFD